MLIIIHIKIIIKISLLANIYGYNHVSSSFIIINIIVVIIIITIIVVIIL